MIKKITWSLIKRIEIMGATKKHTPPMTLLFMKGTGTQPRSTEEN
jgi:hypothetical protein